MKIPAVIVSLFLGVICNMANADTPSCLAEIGKDQKLFIDILKSEILKGEEFSQEFVKKQKTKLYNLVAANVITHCIDVNNLSEFNSDIVDATEIQIPFKLDDKYYQLNVNPDTLFEYINIPTAIMITNLRSKSAGDVITKAETPKDYFFTNDCSDHWVRINIDNSVPVNTAGQAAFSNYAGKEFFIDFPFEKNNRAFPGLIIAAKKYIGGGEEVVWYSNYRLARQNAKKFADALQNTPCGNQNLAVNVVSLNTTPDNQGDKRGWAIGAGVNAGIGAGIATTGALSAAGIISIGAAGTAAGSSAIPVAGWIVAAVAATVATVAGVIAIAPSSLADLNQVMVMDEPIFIK